MIIKGILFDRSKVLNLIDNSLFQAEAPSFVPSSETNTKIPEKPQSSSHLIDFKKYKYDHFISKLSCSFDQTFGEFASPRGICALPDDQLLVANFENDSLLLLNIQGIVHQIYRPLSNPKDVVCGLSNPNHAAVATKKEMIILDLQTKKIVAQTKLKGFYPWNIQYIEKDEVFTGIVQYIDRLFLLVISSACDPSGERIVYLDKNLSEIGELSLKETPSDPTTHNKLYPYAAYFCPDNTAMVLSNRKNVCELRECDVGTGTTKKIYSALPRLQAYSIYVDQEKTCLIADSDNHRLLSFSQNSTMEEYKSKYIHNPYSMTFLSTGALCVTDWNQSFGSRGGIAVISETDLGINQ